MIAIENTLISDEIFTENFVCDLAVCKGACCIEGDAGAPLDEAEIDILEANIDEILPYMTPAGREVVEKNGVFECDGEDFFVTPLINHQECAYLIWNEDNIASCAIEKAFEEKKIDFQKPISCHLYPIRIVKLTEGEALNYHQWDICKCAKKQGNEKNVKVFEFLEIPLRRKYGNAWYEQVQIAYNQLFEK